MFRLLIWLRDRRNRFWVTPSLSVVAAVAVCLVVWLADESMDPDSVPKVSTDALDGLLAIIGSSMLAVATFSLGIVVSATASVASGATPRATELVMGDDGTRRAIGAFIGAFVYAVVAQTALSFDLYGPVGQFLLLVATLLVLGYLVARLVLWVRTVSTLGRLGDTITRLEEAARDGLHRHADQPRLGAAPAVGSTPAGGAVRCERAGYLTHLDVASLQALGAELDATIHVRVRPGAFVDPAHPLAIVARAGGGPERDELDGETAARVRGAFVLGSARSFDQDPRFGIMALSEVGQRALSPAVNDPGTAIQVASVITSLLVELSQRLRSGGSADGRELSFDRVTMPDLDEADLVEDGFAAMARDGAANMDVAVRLQKLLAVVADNGDDEMREAARRQAAVAWQRAEEAMTFDHDREVVEAVHRRMHLSTT